MSALRRLAQAGNAATAATSPRPGSKSTPIPASPVMSNSSSPAPAPSTPRNRVSYGFHRSPADTPSISSSTPFDWDAARSRKPAPYASPLSDKRVKSRKSVGGPTSALPRRVVRKKGIIERITSLPSRIAFEVAMFPHNVPLPTPKTSAWLLGGFMHFTHICTRIGQIRKVPDSDLGWEDMYREGEGESWFDWTVPVSFLLIATSFLNTLYVFSRVKLYRLHNRSEPVSSPHATFVSAQLDFEPLGPPPLTARLWSVARHLFSTSWRFLLGMSAPAKKATMAGKTSRVLQLEVWTPGEPEMTLFSVYSPAHAFLWMATTSANWMLTLVIMGIVGVQLHVMTHSFEGLLKDKEIIAAEVMSEYNDQFVYPRVNPVRKDVAVMTHQSEIVNVWED